MAQRRQGPTENAGPRHRERRGQTQKALGSDTESAGARHRKRWAQTQKAPGLDRKTTAPGHRERETAGPDTESARAQGLHKDRRARHSERRAPTERQTALTHRRRALCRGSVVFLSGPGVLCVGARWSFCGGPALSVGALCVRIRVRPRRSPGALCVGARRERWDPTQRAPGPDTDRRALQRKFNKDT